MHFSCNPNGLKYLIDNNTIFSHFNMNVSTFDIIEDLIIWQNFHGYIILPLLSLKSVFYLKRQKEVDKQWSAIYTEGCLWAVFDPCILHPWKRKRLGHQKGTGVKLWLTD